MMPKLSKSLMLLVAVGLTAAVLPTPATALLGFDTTTPLPVYAVIDTREATYPWVPYTDLVAGAPGVTDLSSVLNYCPGSLQPIGFPFTYYGTEYTQLHISPKGFVTFNDPTPCFEEGYVYCYTGDPYYWGDTDADCDAAAEAKYGPWDWYSRTAYYSPMKCSYCYEYGYESKYSYKDWWTGMPYTGEYCGGGYPTMPGPAKSEPNNMVGVWGGFMPPGICGEEDVKSTILTSVTGAPGSRQLTIQYSGMVPYQYTSTGVWSAYSVLWSYPSYASNFQVVLFEEDGHIEIRMKELDNRAAWYGTFVGIENAAGLKGHLYAVPMYSLIKNRAVAYYPAPTVTLATEPEKVCIHQPVSMLPFVTASKSLGAISKYDWTFSDGSTSAEPSPTKTFLARGNYTVKLEMSFAIGIKFPVETKLRVYNCIPPVARFDVELDEEAGMTPTDRSYDTDGTIVDWEWDFGDGTPPVPGQEPGKHYYQESRAHDVSLKVTDSEGFTDTFTQRVLTKGFPIVLSPGIMASAGADADAVPGQVVRLDGRGADAYRAVRHIWEQTSGGPVALINGESPTPSFVAPELAGDAPEPYAFTLRIYDGRYLSPGDEVVITLAPPAGRPRADAGHSPVALSGSQVGLDGLASSDPDGGTLSYAWTQVRGEPVTLSDATSAKPTFTAPPATEPLDLAFRLVVSDGVLSSTADEVAVQVMPVMTESATGFVTEKLYDVAPGHVLLRALQADPSSGIVRYQWDLGDGTKAQGPIVPHTFAESGDYTIKLDMMDAKGTIIRSYEESLTVYMPVRPAAEQPAIAEKAAPAAGLALVAILVGLAVALRRRD